MSMLTEHTFNSVIIQNFYKKINYYERLLFKFGRLNKI